MSNRLPTLQEEARRCHEAVRHHIAQAAEQALAAGERLTEAKALCPHGTWGDWLKGTGISERSAQRYMRLHRTGFKSAIVADLGMERCDSLASRGESVAPAFGRGASLVGKNDNPVFVSHNIAYWWHDTVGLHLWEYVSISDSQGTKDFVIAPVAPVPVWLLGVLVPKFGRFDQEAFEEITADDAAAQVAALAGKTAGIVA